MDERLATSVSSEPAGCRRVVRRGRIVGATAACLLALLAGCGQKGALVLPTPIAAPPAPNPASAPAAAVPASPRTP